MFVPAFSAGKRACFEHLAQTYLTSQLWKLSARRPGLACVSVSEAYVCVCVCYGYAKLFYDLCCVFAGSVDETIFGNMSAEGTGEILCEKCLHFCND